MDRDDGMSLACEGDFCDKSHEMEEYQEVLL